MQAMPRVLCGCTCLVCPAWRCYPTHACAEWLAAKTGRPISSLRVSVGRDPRLSSPLMAASLAAGLAAAGAGVARFGPCTTPAMFMSCILPGALCWGPVMLIIVDSGPAARVTMAFATRSAAACAVTAVSANP